MNLVTIVEVLLVEDNPAEVRIITELINFGRWNVNITNFRSGIEAIKYLRKEWKYKNSKTPSLIILDLNLPEKNGKEVLREIKGDDVLKCIPVVVLSNSDDDMDITESYMYHANAGKTFSFVAEKRSPRNFSFGASKIENFW